ncbi:MAG TPA: isoleucine--tRNA ligase, partial [Actinobacteria bacterium]|nr:isoleucine--tRNA ligase [Actinomycetota bacterium]
FWDGDPAALATLHEALRITTLCMAPFTPFITERVWQDLMANGDAADSVHLQAWPTPEPVLVDDKLTRDMALVRRIVELGRAARASSGVRTRQPLRRALVSATGWSELSAEMIEQVCEELNIISTDALGSDEAGFVDISMKANFRALGARFGKQTPLVANAIAAADAAAIQASLRATGIASVDAGELGPVEITADEVIVTETPREGWAVASEAGESIALDLVITDELRRAGLAREVVRAIQEARKNAGFEISDRISIWWTSVDADAQLMWQTHSAEIAAEVLATEVRQSVGGEFEVLVPELELRLAITRN